MAGYVSKDVTVLSNGFIENTQSVFLYANTGGDSAATMIGAGYVTDGIQKGMKVGDLVICFNSGGTAANIELLTVASLGTNTNGIGTATLGKNVSIS